MFTSKSEVETFRAKIEEAYASPRLPNHVECSEREYGGVMCDVLAPEIYSSKRVMIYLHGGCFSGGSRASWRGFCSLIANRAYSRVVVPELRLSPAHPYPAPIEDAQSVFRAVFTEEQVACSLESTGANDSLPEVIIAADGSGASIALALLMNLRDRYRKCISHVILLSPWLNLSADSPLITGKKVCDEVMSGDVLRRAGDLYTYSGNLTNPLVSPAFASQEVLKGFPPVYIQMGEKEILLDDAKKFSDLLRQAGNACELDVWPDMMFSFQLMGDYLYDAQLAVEKIGKIAAGTYAADNPVRIENQPMLENSMHSEA